MSNKTKYSLGLDLSPLKNINKVLSNFEGEFEKALRTAKTKGRKSARVILRKVDGIVSSFNVADLRDVAANQSQKLGREFRKISNGVLQSMNDNITDSVTRIQDLEVFEYAKTVATDTRNQVLSALQIPTTSDVDALTRKVASLEKKLDGLRRGSLRQ